MAGGRIDVEVAIDARNAPGDLQRAMAPALGQAKQFAGALGLAFGGAAVAAGVKEVITIGNDYTTTMNTLQAVSGATATQLDAAGARAKELGNDISLPGTSAVDAAAAMTELAKGGFSVDQAMGAAKGTLQLAAAAQIDAASAATIQSQALQSFGLDADYAAKSADVLANAANASSAEITDIAAGLQQSGAVANQFGLSIEDTAATLGVLANAGITGSDAGTLLKSTLLALTDTSNPAQGAIEDLGLSVYNANGEFVGMAALFEQLDAAAASMSEEQYQAATATLFGSDAMRLAGVAAEQGRAGYDTMREAVDRQGAAAEVAAAKTQGLPGAMASVGNAAETLALGVYDLVDGPLEGLMTKAADFVSDSTPKLISGLESAASAMGPIVEIGGELLGVISDLPGPVQAVGVALAALKFTGGDDKIGQTISGWREQITSFREEMSGEQDMQAALAGISGADSANPFQELTAGAEEMSSAVEENAEPLSEMAAGLATLERRSPAVRNMAEGYRGVTERAGNFAARQRELAGQSGAVGGALRNATARAGEFGGVMGGAAVAGARGLTSAAKGAIGVLGGPWMVGIMAATAVLSQITGEMGKAERQQDILSASSEAVSIAQRDMSKAFQESNGAVSEAVVGTVVTQIDSIRSSLEQTAATAPGAFSVFTAGAADIKGWFSGTAQAGTDALNAQQAAADAGQLAKDALDSLGLSNEELAQKVYGSTTQWETFKNVLGGREGGDAAVAQLQELRDAADQAREVAKNTTPGFYDMADAVRVLGDESSTADDRVNALKTALDIITGKQVPLSDAVQGYNDTLRELAENTSNVVDRTQGFGDALTGGVNGAVNTATANGSALRDSLTGIRDDTLSVVDATIRAAIEQGDTLPQAQEKARAAIAGNQQALLGLGNQYGLTQTQIEQMAAAEGLLPEQVIMLASLTGATDVTSQLTVIKGLLDANADGVDIPTSALTADTIEQLRNVGAVVETDINGKPGIVRVSAPNELALSQLQAVIERNLPDKNVRVTAATDEAEAKLMELQNRQYTAYLKVQVANGNMNYGEAVAAAFNQQAALRAAGRKDGGPAGAIRGAGGPRDDNILIAASPGEHMLDADDVKALGGQQGVYDMRAGLDAGMRPMMVPAFADGGAMDRVRDLGRRGNGGPYVWGGAEVTGADCSGWVAILQKTAMGQGESGRLGTTNSLLAGEWPGLVAGTQGPFVVGTSEEHMAATIDGVNYESGGANGGIQMGGAAAGAFDSQFSRQYYLPWELFAPPYDPNQLGSAGSAGMTPGYTGSSSSAKKASWEAKDDLALDSAKIAIRQAEEDLAAAQADPKKSAADKDQAQSKVARAQQKVADLEAKREAAARGESVPAPQAPDLATNFTDEELSRQDAASAVAEANQKRNEVYADPASTPEQRADADRSLQRARNALSKDGASAGGSSSGSGTGGLVTADQWSTAIGDIIGGAVTETIGDILGYYEADDMGPLAKAGVALVTGLAGMQKQQLEENARIVAQAPTSTPEELRNQLPATPGTPDFAALVEKGLLTAPMKLYDTGGEWKSGTFGLNMSGETEEVLTGSQRRGVMRELQLARAAREAAPAGASGTPGDRPMSFEVNGFDRREMAQGIRNARMQERFESNSVRIGES